MNLLSTIQAYGTSEGVSKAWDERGRGRRQLSDKAQRALATYVPMNKEKRRIAEETQHIVAKVIGGQVTHDNAPFDVMKGKIAIEVKTIFPGVKNSKITMHGPSLERKVTLVKKLKLTAFTVVLDKRDGTFHVGKGLGSFRLRHGSIEEVSLKDLAGKLK